ncbi:hypothetical protein FACS1894132_12160 [Clostridia bacterium]|nr:hypothetical protein FACS1894132_12160 [Clostridia bacterium]
MAQNKKVAQNKKTKKIGKITFKVTKHTFGLIFSTILSIIMIGVITLTICCTVLTVWVLEFMDEADEITIAQYEQKFNTVMYVNNPEYVPELGDTETNPQWLSVYEVKNSTMRIPITIDQVPQMVRNAFVCVEDERFYQHDGVDYKRTFAAFANMFLHFYDTEQGGSTLTQQLIKNITGDRETNMQRKIREIFRAMKFEKTYSKDEILEAYINNVEFGNGAIGIEYASQKYFGKSTFELSLAEIACLSGIPQNPEVINPFASLERNRTRQKYVLFQMYENGAISYDEYQAALAEKLIFTNSDEYKALHPEHENTTIKEQDVTPWYVDAAIYELRDYFIANENMNQAEAIKHINTGGYKIYLTVDMNMQNYLEDKYKDWAIFGEAKDKEGKPMQSSFIAMDYTGSVLSVVGGLGDKTEYGSLCFNRAVQAKRDMGSTIKPVTSYGAAFYYDQAYFSQLMVDQKITLPDGKLWPPNYGGGVSGATYNLYYCLQRSLNTVPAQIVQKMGTQTVFDFATQRLGLGLVSQDNAIAPLSIGSLTYGITLEDLVNAYIPYGAGGMIYEAHIISEVKQGDGGVLFSNTGKGGTQAIDPDTAWVVNRLMNMVVNAPNGTGVAGALPNKNVVGKTGTSDNIYDLSFIGLTPDFVSGVWMGFDDKFSLSANISSASVWKRIIGDYANTYNTGRQWPTNENVIQAKYCTVTGLIASPTCPQSNIYGYYKPSNAPKCDGEHVPEDDEELEW